MDKKFWAELIRPDGLQKKCDRLLGAMLSELPVDALCIMRLEEECLVPVSALGLSKDAFGRRFDLIHQPRLQAIMATGVPVHFAHDADLPDPFDGLIPNHKGKLDIHDCMGVRLNLNGKPWGLITLDALQAGSFPVAIESEVKRWVEVISAVIEQNILVKKSPAAHYLLGSQSFQEGPLSMIGESSKMQALQRAMSVVAGSDLTVLIQGETGTGKELVAKGIHDQSQRNDQAYVFVNCAALPEQLAESELFGHVKGAFTGAVNERKGKFELAHGGTLFLDEVGELPLLIQAKILRAIQSGDIQRVGSDEFHHVDVRIVAATNRNLASMVAEQAFRADLYHRLSVYPIHVPVLKEREQDVLLLAGYFIEKSRAQLGLRGLRLSGRAESVLMQYTWPGNVRELEHTISRAALKALALHPGQSIVTLNPDDLDLMIIHSSADNAMSDYQVKQQGQVFLNQAVKELQISMIKHAREMHQGNWSMAAKRLGLDSGNLHRLAKRLGLK